jgi:alpha-beta hydrolase superfamily lysophospholipase
MSNGLSPTQQETLDSNGLALHVEHFHPSGPPRQLVVMVHGFGAHCGLYPHVIGAMLARGMAVTQFDCRGNGRSEGIRGHVERFDDYHADLSLVVRRARELSPGVPWALLAHSLGGAIALDHVLRGLSLPQPDRVVVAAPWLELKMKVSSPKRAAAHVFARLKPTLSIGNGLKAEDLSRNPAVVTSFFKDPLIHHEATARWFSGVLGAQASVRAAAAQLQVPTLMLLAGQDRIVSNEVAMTFARTAGSAMQVRTYPDLFHELYLEPERDQVIGDIASWLSTPLS